jgi:hypothetical protein
MAGNRIMRGGAVARVLLCAAALLALAACGGEGGEITTEVPDKEGDSQILNNILARQIAVVDAYDASLGALSGYRLALARELRAQEQEHVDAIVEALRKIGGEADPSDEAVSTPVLRGEAEHLAFLAELEGRTIELELGAISSLTAPGARTTLATILANQAQHLVLLRRALGATPLQAVPSAFENGTEPLP